MGLEGKLVSRISIKSDGNVFHDIFTHKFQEIQDICSETIDRISLERGQWGTVGSVVTCHFIHDGEKKFVREMIEAIAVDEKKKSVTLTVMEGDVKAAYKSFKFIIDVDTNVSDQDDVVTWTIVYEKKTADVPEPHALMDFCLSTSKTIERHCLLVPN